MFKKYSIFLSFIYFIGLLSFIFTAVNIDKVFHWEETVDFHEYSLSVRDWGKGRPTVIIEGGLNQPKHKYFLISFFTSYIVRTISYDHAGIGLSTKSIASRTLPNYVIELDNLINKKDLHPPFIFIGHSSGGHIVRYYTYLYPERVAGLILIDTPPEDWFNYINKNWTKKETRDYFKWWYPKNPDMTDIKILEKLQYENNCNLLQGVKLPKKIPVLMFTGNNVRHFRKDAVGKKQDMKAWVKMQQSLIVNLVNSKQIVDLETGHYPFKDKPVMVISEINKFVKELKFK